MTVAEYRDQLAACNFRVPEQVSNLVTSSYTNVMFNKMVVQKHLKNAVGAYNYFSGFFNTGMWADGQGTDEVREYATDVYIPYTFSHFVRTMQLCDPNNANECNTDYCKVPQGGRGTLPGIYMYKWGFETERDCIANIRSIRDFEFWASQVTKARTQVDEQVMNMFYTMAAIKTAGHKVVFQGERNSAGQLMPVYSANARNPFRSFNYNYMEELFPAAIPETMVPMDIQYLEKLARHWTQFQNGNEIARGSRGQLIWELWYGDDYYQEQAINNADYMEKIKLTEPANLFAGYSLQSNPREVIGNWATKIMPWLPRFAPSTGGGIIPVDSMEAVPIEVNNEFVPSREFDNAPIGLALIASKKQGTVLKRPALTKSGAGFPILPITGDGGWMIRNDYDKDCNKDLNQPYSQKRFEMGFRMDDPDAAMAILYRRRLFNLRPTNECDLAPIFSVAPKEVDCSLTNIGCEDNKKRASESVTQTDFSKAVICNSVSCGSDTLIRIKVERIANQPAFNSLGCECGDTVDALVYDEDGVFVRSQTAVVQDLSLIFPYGYAWIELGQALEAGECIKGILCRDNTPWLGNVIDSWDSTDEGFEDLVGVRFMLDSQLGSCDVGDNVVVRFYDAAGTLLGTDNSVTIAEADHAHYLYRVTGLTDDLKVQYPTQASVTVDCD